MFVKIVKTVEIATQHDNGVYEVDTYERGEGILFEVEQVSWDFIPYEEARDSWAFYPFGDVLPNDEVLQISIVPKRGDSTPALVNVQKAILYIMNNDGKTIDSISTL